MKGGRTPDSEESSYLRIISVSLNSRLESNKEEEEDRVPDGRKGRGDEVEDRDAQVQPREVVV